MHQTILITGATDGIGLETAKKLAKQGHTLLVHGRSESKLAQVKEVLTLLTDTSKIHTYLADMSNLKDVHQLVKTIVAEHNHLDVLINNAGVLKATPALTDDNIDIRFVVNTVAPYILTCGLLPLLKQLSRVINVSSAAQAEIDLHALQGNTVLSDMEAYSQSKLAITMWTRVMAAKHTNTEFYAVNPGSLLGSKMVKEGFGMQGGDLSTGANILSHFALEPTLEGESGQYFDNDAGRFSSPHTSGLNEAASAELMDVLALISSQSAI